MNPKVDAYIRGAKKWRPEMRKLRDILLTFPFAEEWKWGKPCYTIEQSNIVLLIGFKNYCALLLCKGALLKDPASILVKAGENTQAARQIRFTGLDEIVKAEPVLRTYLKEAVEAQKAGLEVEFKAATELKYCEELQNALDKGGAFKAAFEALTPGRRRAYNIHFSAPKQSQTRVSRIEKSMPQILKGKGLNEEYIAEREKARR